MSSLIVVESQNDKFFIEALASHLNLKNVELKNPICNDFECLNGFANLKNRLKEIKFDRYEKIGIILDANEKGVKGKIDFINDALTSVCDDVKIEKENVLYKSAKLDVKFACYMVNVDGKGELETLLRVIKSRESVYADCLEAWKSCLAENGKSISKKDFDKFWINNYLRFDTCTKLQSKQKYRKCNNEEAMKKDIWDFEHEALSGLKDFLKLTNES